MKIPMKKCKQRLTILWFSGSLTSLILLVFQTMLGHYRENTDEVWGWFLPSVMPMLSLIISVIVMDFFGKGIKIRTVDRFLFRISFTVSAIYLFFVSLPILLQPFSASSPVKLMQQSNLWLGPFQGLVAASLGVFFVKKELE